MLRVALDTPLRRLFDYLLPPACGGAAVPAGMRVRVPFGRQRLVGVVMASADSSELAPERLKRVLEVLDPVPVLETAALGLLSWAAEYYHHPIGEVVAGALPKALRLGAPAQGARGALGRHGSRARSSSRRVSRVGRRGSGRCWSCSPGRASAAPRAPRAPARLARGRARAARPRLARRASEITAVPARPPGRAYAGPAPPHYRRAGAGRGHASGRRCGGYAAFVLHGITGSGKTEVYLQMMRPRARQAAARRWCWCPRSGSPRSSSGASARASRRRWRCCTRRSPIRSVCAPGVTRFSGRGAHRARHALGGVRAGAGPRPDHRR